MVKSHPMLRIRAEMSLIGVSRSAQMVSTEARLAQEAMPMVESQLVEPDRL